MGGSQRRPRVGRFNTKLLSQLVHRGKGDLLLEVDNEGRTPLHWAAAYDNASCLEEYIKLGADQLAEDKDGMTAVGIARKEGQSFAALKALPGGIPGFHRAQSMM